jgi:hypothetical protein
MAYSIAGALLPITVTFLPRFRWSPARRFQARGRLNSEPDGADLRPAIDDSCRNHEYVPRQSTAIPVMPIVAMVALQSRFEEAVAAFSLFFGLIGSVITLAVFIVLSSQAVDRGHQKGTLP